MSVIVPIYNVEPYLDRCMESIVGQTYPNLEIIMVDDGSPDNCPEKCDMWAKRDSRIKVIHKKNGGLGNARNSGLEIATGEYVAFVDSDDYIDTDMYSTLMAEAIAHDADTVYCGFRRQLPSLDMADTVEMQSSVLRGDEIKELARRYIMDFSTESLNVGVWHAIYRRSLIDFKFVSEREYMSEDAVFTQEFLKRCKCYVYVPRAMYNYMYNASGISKNTNETTLARALKTAGKFNELYEGTSYRRVGDGYAFCQIFCLLHEKVAGNKRLPLKERYRIVKDIVCNPDYQEMLSDKTKFKFRKGLNFRYRKMVYHMQRNRMHLLNFLAIRLLALHGGVS